MEDSTLFSKPLNPLQMPVVKSSQPPGVEDAGDCWEIYCLVKQLPGLLGDLRKGLGGSLRLGRGPLNISKLVTEMDKYL